MTVKKTTPKKNTVATKDLPKITTKKIIKKVVSITETLVPEKNMPASTTGNIASKSSVSKTAVKKVAPKKTIPSVKVAATGSKKDVDFKKELIDTLIEKGRESSTLSYEEVIAFNERNHLTEKETADLFKALEREHIELLMEEELHGHGSSLHDIEKDDLGTQAVIKEKFASSIHSEDLHDSDEEDADDGEERPTKDVTDSTYITDGVKCYLRDIGKIPLLNKVTEKVISDKIANSKRSCIDAISHFPFVHKEFLTIGEKLHTNTLPLKDIIQFAEFDEENLPKVEEEKKAFLETINKIEALIKNEETI